jgi:hypothetical protein
LRTLWVAQRRPRLTFVLRMHQIGVPRGTRPLAGGAGGAAAPSRPPRRRTACVPLTR